MFYVLWSLVLANHKVYVCVRQYPVRTRIGDVGVTTTPRAGALPSAVRRDARALLWKLEVERNVMAMSILFLTIVYTIYTFIKFVQAPGFCLLYPVLSTDSLSSVPRLGCLSLASIVYLYSGR